MKYPESSNYVICSQENVTIWPSSMLYYWLHLGVWKINISYIFSFQAFTRSHLSWSYLFMRNTVKRVEIVKGEGLGIAFPGRLAPFCLPSLWSRLPLSPRPQPPVMGLAPSPPPAPQPPVMDLMRFRVKASVIVPLLLSGVSARPLCIAWSEGRNPLSGHEHLNSSGRWWRTEQPEHQALGLEKSWTTTRQPPWQCWIRLLGPPQQDATDWVALKQQKSMLSRQKRRPLAPQAGCQQLCELGEDSPLAWGPLLSRCVSPHTVISLCTAVGSPCLLMSFCKDTS